MPIRVGSFGIVRREGNLWMKDRVRREGPPDNLWVGRHRIAKISLLVRSQESSEPVWIKRYTYPQMLITLCISGGFGHGA